MIQVPILVGDLHTGHLGSDDVIRGQTQVFANNSQMKRAAGTGMCSACHCACVSLCSACQDASPDMQYYLLVSTCDLTWP